MARQGSNVATNEGVCGVKMGDPPLKLTQCAVTDYETGKRRAEAFIEQYKSKLPSAVACFADDLEASLNDLKLPSLHQSRSAPRTWRSGASKRGGGAR